MENELIYSYIDPTTGVALIGILFGVSNILGYLIDSIRLKIKYRQISSKDTTKENIVIYSEDKRYFNIFEPILNELEQRKLNAIYLVSDNSDPVFKKEYKYIKIKSIGNISDIKTIQILNNINSYIFVSTTPGLEVYQWKRSENTNYYIHLQHSPGDLTLYRMFGLDYYDAIFVGAKYQVDQVHRIESIRNLKPKETPIIGIPYMDNMNIDSNGYNDKIILLSPSWGPSSLLNVYGDKLIDNLLELDYTIIIRPHPQSLISEKELISRLQDKYSNIPKIKWDYSVSNKESMDKSSVMVSDFSSILLEYLILYNKPVIYSMESFENNIYDAWWDTEDTMTHSILDQFGVELNEGNLNDIADIIRCLAVRDNMDTIRDKLWENRGNGAKSAVDFIEQKLEDLKTNS